ncbi:chitinase [Streptomyces sp. NPDC058657]|uniref:chitinase n=1 Tax=unclassified Streptomyces TaxID=2593676 RepID=UPI0036598CF2
MATFVHRPHSLSRLAVGAVAVALLAGTLGACADGDGADGGTGPAEKSTAGKTPAGSAPPARDGGARDDGARKAAGAPQVPAHALTGYWQNFTNEAKQQKLAEVPDAYDIIAVSFADAAGQPGEVGFKLASKALGGYTVDQFKADIKAKHQAGKMVIVSVGGENGKVEVKDAAAAERFATSVHRLMTVYGFDGVDIDTENNGFRAEFMIQALKSLREKAGPRLVLTMAPQTIDMQKPTDEYFRTALGVKDFLTVVNTQFYNSGSQLGCDGKSYQQGTVDFLTALACIQLEGGLDPSQVGLGLPTNKASKDAGYVDPSVIAKAMNCLTEGTDCGKFKPAKKYPGLRGAMAWSTNWDAAYGNEWSTAVGARVRKLP